MNRAFLFCFLFVHCTVQAVTIPSVSEIYTWPMLTSDPVKEQLIHTKNLRLQLDVKLQTEKLSSK